MSDLLLEGPLVVVQPELVRRVGLLEATLVQQLQYWLRRATCMHDGHAWVYKTYSDWSDEIGVSAKAARGALDRLRRDGLVVAIDNPTDSRDRTLWWRIDRDALGDTPAPSAPQGRPAGHARAGRSTSAPAGSSHAGVPKPVQRLRAETTKEEEPRPDPREAVPADFPEHLRPHAREVMRILKAVAEDHGAKRVWPQEVARAVMARPRHPLVAVAHDVAGWAVDPKREIKDVVGTYRTFLKRERELEATERLADDGTPTAARPPAGGNVHPIGRGRMSNADRVDARIRELRGDASSGLL